MIHYTPRQLSALIEVTQKDAMHEAAERLSISAQATHGDARSINKRIKDLSR